MSMLSLKNEKAMKPMLEIADITEDAGLSRPNQPASAPTSRPNHPSQRGSARLVRMATAYCGTTTPQPRKLPAAFGHQGDGRKGVGGGPPRRLSCRVCGDVGRH
jgi:hypothetical protein